MRALVQRVSRSQVQVSGQTVGRIGPGLLVLVGVSRADDEEVAGKLAAKIARLRIFADDQGKMNRSVSDVGGSLLAVSQFTLCADTSSGNRPSYTLAAPPRQAQPIFEEFVAGLRAAGLHVETGRFGEEMQVELINDGPVTIWLDTETQ